MKQYFGLQPTGRQFKDSGSTLVELVDDAELRHTAIVLYDPFLEDADLGLDFRGVLSFLEHPMVTGLVGLKHHELLTGVFIYPTGAMWPVRELLRMAKDRREPLGLRAALELGILGTQILIEASETGARSGCFSHGSLNPWRIALKPTGELQIFGYGVPQVEVIAYLRDSTKVPPADAIRYVPPERLERAPEELAADTFVLMLMVAEAATGRRIHDEPQTKNLIEAVREGETIRRVHRLGLSRKVAAMFAKALGPDAEARLTGEGLVDALTRELDSASGPTLEQLMESMLGQKKVARKRASPLVSVPTTITERGRLAPEPDDRWHAPDRSRPLRRARGGEAPEEPLPPDPIDVERDDESEEVARPVTTGAVRRPRRARMSDPGEPPRPPRSPRNAGSPPPSPEPAPEEPTRARSRSRTGTFTRPTPIGDRVPAPPGSPDDGTGAVPRRRLPRRARRVTEEAPSAEAPPTREVPRRRRAGSRSAPLAGPPAGPPESPPETHPGPSSEPSDPGGGAPPLRPADDLATDVGGFEPPKSPRERRRGTRPPPDGPISPEAPGEGGGPSETRPRRRVRRKK